MNETSVPIRGFVLAWARGAVLERRGDYDGAAAAFLIAVNDAPSPEDANRAMDRACAAAERARGGAVDGLHVHGVRDRLGVDARLGAVESDGQASEGGYRHGV